MSSTFVLGVLCGLGVASIQVAGVYLVTDIIRRRNRRKTFPLRRL